MGLLNKIRNLVRFVKITGPADNSKQFPVQQVTFKGKVANTMMAFPYGMYANVTTTDGLGLMFSVEGNEENRTCIGMVPQKRPTDLALDEVAVYHPYSDSFIKFRNDGSISLQASILNVEGDLDISGDVEISGNLTVGGDTTLGVIVTSGGINISGTHTHVGSPTAPTGLVSPTGIPI